MYAQIGLITLIGLAAKNAILIVEFAKERTDSGMELVKATLAATSLAIFVVSVLYVLITRIAYRRRKKLAIALDE